MRMKARAGLWLTALGLALAPPARSAVMTGYVHVNSGPGPYNISYTLAQDAATLQVNIRKSSDKSLVRALSGADIPDYAKSMGQHVADVVWDGKTTGGATAPNGSYYAEVVTTGYVNAGMYPLAGPTIQSFDRDGVLKNSGRNYYGFGVMRAPDSPWNNMAFMPARTNGNTDQVKGVYRVNVDTTSLGGFSEPDQPASSFDWISGATSSDGKIVLTGQTTGTLKIVNPDGTVYRELTGNDVSGVYTRGVRFAGTADSGNLVFVDVGSTGGGVNAISQLSVAGAGSAVPSSTVLISNATLALPAGALPRTLAVAWDGSNNPTTIYVSYWSPAGVAKYNKVGGAWVKDAAFSWAPPTGTAPKYSFVALSPDNKILWVGMNDDVNSSASAVVEGVDAVTGKPYGDGFSYQLMPGYNPESLSVASNGNLYILNYSGFDTGTTANAVALIAPPDTGSSDTTRGFDFLVSQDTQVTVSNVKVTNITNHGATITWTTNVPSDSTVSYGTTAGAEDHNIVNSAPTMNHSITLGGLTAGTKYYFVVKSTAAGLADGVSAEGNFTTTALIISDVKVNSITDSSAVVTFTTNQPGMGIVRYARTSGGYNPDSPTADARHPGEYSDDTTPGTAAPLSTSHSITLTGLSPNTKYYFIAETGTAPGGTANSIFKTRPASSTDSPESAFTTLNTITTSSVSLTATQNSATLNFTTNPASAAVVNWGTAPDALTNTVNVASGTSHAAQLTGLSAGTTYYYTVTLSASGAATRTSPVNALVTAVAGGTASTITQSTAADFGLASRSQIALGASGGLIQLQKQGVPSAPVQGTNLPGPIRYSGVVALNGYIYSIAGYDGANSVNTVYYAPINVDGSIGTWATTAPLPTNKGFIANMCVTYGGYIYALGDGTEVHYTSPNPDGTLKPWQDTTSLPENRDIGSAVALDGVIYVMGGEVDGDDPAWPVLQAQVRGDGTLGPWTTRSNTKDGVYLQRAVANAHRVYSLGGLSDAIGANYSVQDEGSPMAATAQPLQDLSPWLWNTLDMGQPSGVMDKLYYSMGAGIVRGSIVLAGGRNGTPTYESSVSYGPLNQDGSVGAFTDSGQVLPFAVRDQDATSYNGMLYSIGGRVTGGATTNQTIYIPFTDQANQAGATYTYAGNLDSKIMDLGALSNLTHLKVTASGSGVEVRYRFAGDDGVFTPYLTPGSLDADISGAARYFQYQLVLTGNGTSTPVVSSVALTTQAVAPGTFTKTDVENALKAAGGLVTLSAQDKAKLDLDGDGAVTLKDAVAINRKVNGL